MRAFGHIPIQISRETPPNKIRCRKIAGERTNEKGNRKEKERFNSESRRQEISQRERRLCEKDKKGGKKS